MINLISKLQKLEIDKIENTRKELDSKFEYDFKAGDSISIKYKISEGKTSRIQVFSGVVIAKTKSKSNLSSTFTVRKISSNIGVEKKFFTYSPLVCGIEIIKKGIVKRSKLYYLRSLTGKAARIKEKIDFTGKKK